MNLQAAEGKICEPYTIKICNICGGDFDKCEHHNGELYGPECKPYLVCNICGQNFSDCKHQEGDSYGGTVCDPPEGQICNICGDDYSLCEHNNGKTYNPIQCTYSYGQICNICGQDFTSCEHHRGDTYYSTVCTTYPGNICNICNDNIQVCGHEVGGEDGGSIFAGNICNICNHNFDDSSLCEHHKGDSYDTVCLSYNGKICNICGGNFEVCEHHKGDYYGGTVCQPYDASVCNICFKDFSSCEHKRGEMYGIATTVCTPYRVCNICEERFDSCSHQEGTIYDGTTCAPITKTICNICGNNYEDSNVCSHSKGTTYYMTDRTSKQQAEQVWMYLQMILYYQNQADWPAAAFDTDEYGSYEEIEAYQSDCRQTVEYLQYELLYNPLVMENSEISQYFADNVLYGKTIGEGLNYTLIVNNLKSHNSVISEVFGEYQYREWLECKTVLLDCVPVVGSVKMIAQGILGHDLVTGRVLTCWERVFNGTVGTVTLAGEVGMVVNIVKSARSAAEISKFAEMARISRDERIISFAERLKTVFNPNSLALGLSDYLDEFASSNGCLTWKDFPDPNNWKLAVLDNINNPNIEIKFNLTGIDSPWASISRAAGGAGGATDWELLQIKLNPQAWDRIEWFLNGELVPNPFV